MSTALPPAPDELVVDLSTNLTSWADFDGLLEWQIGVAVVDHDAFTAGEELRTRIGSGIAYTMSRELIESSDAFAALDDIDASTDGCVARALFDNESSWEALQELLDEPFLGPLVYVDYLSIEPEHRGKGYGIGTMVHLLRSYRALGVNLAVCYPGPSEHREGVSRDAAVHALQRHWSSLGFRPFRDGVFVFAL